MLFLYQILPLIHPTRPHKAFVKLLANMFGALFFRFRRNLVWRCKIYSYRAQSLSMRLSREWLPDKDLVRRTPSAYRPEIARVLQYQESNTGLSKKCVFSTCFILPLKCLLPVIMLWLLLLKRMQVLCPKYTRKFVWELGMYSFLLLSCAYTCLVSVYFVFAFGTKQLQFVFNSVSIKSSQYLICAWMGLIRRRSCVQ